MEDDLWWKKTFEGRRPLMEDDLKNADDLKNEDDLKNKDNLKNVFVCTQLA